ncbi:MAG: helix-turn-helix transcriptional regulator [Ruminococcaceae bacterium]|nr:helix-turn-helix transcriptional regulator [Oscillospiraceae bacterium]
MVTGKQIFCGFFDSSKVFRQIAETQERTVSNYEIELFDSNGGVSFIGGNKYEVKRGMLLCVKPGTKRHSRLPVSCRFLKIDPDSKVSENIIAILDEFPECVYLDSEYQTEHLLCAFEQLWQLLIRSTCDEDALKLNALFYDLLYQCKQITSSIEQSRGVSASSKLALDTKSYLDSHFHEPCSLSIISEAVHASPNHIRAVFHKQFELSPYEYVLQKRIEQAKIWILEQELPFTEIAMRLSFCSQSHFNKLFKENVGCTPKEYREKDLSVYLN